MKANTSLDTFSINVFSSRGRLDLASFLCQFLLISTCVTATNYFLPPYLAIARASGDLRTGLQLYAAWFLVNLVGLMLTIRLVSRRWSIWSSSGESNWIMRQVVRISLISPVLSLVTLFLSVFIVPPSARKTQVKQVANGAWLIWFIATVFIGHAALLFYEFKTGQVDWGEKVFWRLKSKTQTASASIKTVLNAELVYRPTDTDWFYVHVWSYLNPSAKYAVASLSDWDRLENFALRTQSLDGCLQTDEIVAGVPTANCIMRLFSRTGAVRPYVLSQLVLWRESQYRQKVSDQLRAESEKERQQVLSALEQVQLSQKNLAMSALAATNMLDLIEEKYGFIGLDQLLKPLGLLPVFGSPEMVLLAFTRDVQHTLVVAKLVPQLHQQVAQLEDALKSLAAFIGKDQADRIIVNLQNLRQRLKAYEKLPQLSF